MNDSTERRGLLYGVAAYSLWGVFPLYFQAIRHVPAVEILAHRIVWSFLLLAAVVTARKSWASFRAAVKPGRTAWLLLASSFLIAGNWLTFIVAVTSGSTLQASLGYFITPLANVALGVAFLGERLRRLQLISIAFAATGVVVYGVYGGEPPTLALLLTGSFALYGLVRKIVAADSLTGLLVETTVLLPAALAWFVFGGARWDWSVSTFLLLAASGPITAVPLLLFAAAARRLPLVTLGFLQYLGPTIQFLLATLAFGEPLSAGKTRGFALIWIAVALFAAESVRQARKPFIRHQSGDEE